MHLFGVTSSPGCANFALKKMAIDYEGQCGSEAASLVKNDVYIDDGLRSVSTSDTAVTLVKRTKNYTICQTPARMLMVNAPILNLSTNLTRYTAPWSWLNPALHP